MFVEGLVTEEEEGLVTEEEGLVTEEEGLVTEEEGLVTEEEGLVTEEELRKLKEEDADITYEVRCLKDAQDLGILVDYESKKAQEEFWNLLSKDKEIWIKAYVDVNVYDYLSRYE